MSEDEVVEEEQWEEPEGLDEDEEKWEEEEDADWAGDDGEEFEDGEEDEELL